MRPRPRETKLALKKHRILGEVFRDGSCSRFDLARRLNINASMVGEYVEEFLRGGLLVEDEPASTGRGRSPVPLRLDPAFGCFLGLDFEALRARAVLCDFSGAELHRKEISFRPNLDRETVLRAITSLARTLAAKADRPLLSVGVAAPGQVDALAGRVLHYELLPDFDEVPLRERFEKDFGELPVFIEDNIRSLAHAELLRGSGRGCRNFLCLAVRSGMGLGIVIDGNLYGGANSMAGEIGYTFSPSPDSSNGDARARSMTELVTATGFVREVRRSLESRRRTAPRRDLLEKRDALSLADIVSAADAGDDFLRARLEELGARLGIVVANLANLFAPEKIVLAGEVPSCSPMVRNPMERIFREHTLPQILRTAYLEDSALGGFAGAFGAAWMGLSRLFPEDEETLMRRINGQLSPAEVLRAG
ncbi:MAG: ROK family protein [Verrucomicrobiales bacterium]